MQTYSTYTQQQSSVVTLPGLDPPTTTTMTVNLPSHVTAAVPALPQMNMQQLLPQQQQPQGDATGQSVRGVGVRQESHPGNNPSEQHGTSSSAARNASGHDAIASGQDAKQQQSSSETRESPETAAARGNSNSRQVPEEHEKEPATHPSRPQASPRRTRPVPKPRKLKQQSRSEGSLAMPISSNNDDNNNDDDVMLSSMRSHAGALLGTQQLEDDQTNTPRHEGL